MHNHKTTTQGLHQNHGIEPNALPEYLFHGIYAQTEYLMKTNGVITNDLMLLCFQ